MVFSKIRYILSLAFLWVVVASAVILDNKTASNVIYFPDTTSGNIHRFDLATSSWKSSLELPSKYGTITAVEVDGVNIYVAYGKFLYRYDIEIENETHLANLSDDVSELLSDDNLLFANYSTSSNQRIVSFNKSTNTIIDVNDNWYWRSFRGSSVSKSQNKIIGRSIGSSPSDIVSIAYSELGEFLSSDDSPYHGAYASASRTWIFPNESRVVDDSGTIYSSDNLIYQGKFDTKIEDMSFSGSDIAIVLGENKVIAYSNAFLPTGHVDVDEEAFALYVRDSNVLLFSEDETSENGISVETISLDQLNAPTPGVPVDPHELAFVPDTIFLDDSGILYCFSSAFQSIFRWDTINQRYISTIPLLGSPEFVAYSQELNRIYSAYHSGLVRKIDLNIPGLLEVPFVTLSSRPLGISPAGNYLFAVDGSGAWVSHYTYSMNGDLISSKDWNYFSREYLWSDINQKMYFFRDDTSPNDIIWENIDANGTGLIGDKFDSPYHSSNGIKHPIRVAPDGSVVILGSGFVYDAITLEKKVSGLGNEVIDMTWIGNDVFSIRSIDGQNQLQTWKGQNYGLDRVSLFPEELFYIRRIPNTENLVLGYFQSNGVPTFEVLDKYLNPVVPNVLESPRGLSAKIFNKNTIELSWKDVNFEGSYIVERRTGENGIWTELSVLPEDSVTYRDEGVFVGNQYEYRIRAKNGNMTSAYSDSIIVYFDLPTRLGSFSVADINTDSVSLTWDDVERESGYLLERKKQNEEQWNTVVMLDADHLSFQDTGLEGNVVYEYRLSSFNEIGSSPDQLVLTVHTFVAPDQVVINWASRGNLSISWNRVPDADGYRIYYYDNSKEIWVFYKEFDVSTVECALQVTQNGKYAVVVEAFNELGNVVSSIHWVDANTVDVEYPSDLQIKWLPGRKVQLSWTKLNNITGYRLYLYSNDKWVYQKTIEGSENSILVDQAPSSGFYCALEVYDDYGDIANVVTVGESPLLHEPTHLNAEWISQNRVSLTWQDVSGEKGYRVYYHDGVNWSFYKTFDADVNQSYFDLDSGEDYFFIVKSFDDLGEYASDILTLNKNLTHFFAPIINSVSWLRNGVIHVEWDRVNLADGYRVFINSGDRWEFYSNFEKDVSQCDIVIGENSDYRVIVKAYNRDGESISDAYSLELDEKYLNKPTLSSVKWMGGKVVQLDWSDVSFETGYQVFFHNGNQWVYHGNYGADTVSCLIDLGFSTECKFLVKAVNSRDIVASNVIVLPSNQSALYAAENVMAEWTSFGELALQWTDGLNEEYYQIYVKIGDGGWQWMKNLPGDSVSTSLSIGRNETCTVLVRSVKGGEKADSGLAILDVNTSLLDAPIGLKAVWISSSSVRLNWNDVNGENAYHIYTKQGDSGWLWSVQVDANITQAELSFESSSQCEFIVKSVNGSLVSESSILVLPANQNALSHPSIQGAEWSGNHKVLLTWFDVQNEDGYQVFYDQGHGWTWYQNVDSDVTELSLDLPGNESSAFVVTAFRDTEKMASQVYQLASNEVGMDAPSNLTASWGDGNNVVLAWDDVTNEDGYQVFYHQGSGWKWYANTSADIHNINVSLPSGSECYFLVKSYNSNGVCSSEVLRLESRN